MFDDERAAISVWVCGDMLTMNVSPCREGVLRPMTNGWLPPLVYHMLMPCYISLLLLLHHHLCLLFIFFWWQTNFENHNRHDSDEKYRPTLICQQFQYYSVMYIIDVTVIMDRLARTSTSNKTVNENRINNPKRVLSDNPASHSSKIDPVPW